MTEPLRFVDFKAHDAGQVMPVMQTAFDPQYSEAWTEPQLIQALCLPGTVLIAALRGTQICGFALTRTMFDETELLLLAVSPAAQRQAIGSQLLEQALKHAARAKAKVMFLEVRCNNSALSFYVRHKFRQIGIRHNYYRSKRGEPFDALTMAVDIPSACHISDQVSDTEQSIII